MRSWLARSYLLGLVFVVVSMILLSGCGRAGKMLQLAKTRNLPITMYGKVVDQQGAPVSGAKVNIDIAGGGAFAPGTGLSSYMTDKEGRFTVTGKGDAVAILSIEHPKLTRVVFETGDWTISLDAMGKYGQRSSWRTYNTPDHPYVIRAWRVEEFGDVESGRGGYYPEPNGASSEKRGIVVTCRREPKEPGVHWSKQKGSWSITFRPSDGGIQETGDLDLNDAPVDGYKREITVSMERGASDYKVRIYPGRRYYYKAYNGEWYGSFSASFEPYMYDDHCRVNVDYKYNSHGSRNLAVRPRN